MKPMTKQNYIGIEIEFFCNKEEEQIEKSLDRYLKTCESFDLADDGSIEPPDVSYRDKCKGISEYNTYELRLLIKEKNVHNVMQELNLAFKEIKPRVNKTCGLHVHIDARNRNRELMFHNLVSCQDMFIRMQPGHRKENEYCERNSKKEFQFPPSQNSYYFEEYDNDQRHSVVNGHSYQKHETIEVRIHAGCVNPEQIGSWVEVLLEIVNQPKKLSADIKYFKDFKKHVSTGNKRALDYVQKRSRWFGTKQAEYFSSCW